MKIVFLDADTIILDDDMDFSSLEGVGELTRYGHTGKSETVQRARGAETVIVNKVMMTGQIIRQLDGLRHIAVIATGYNNVDVEAANQADVCVTNVRGYARHTVPQHTFGLILNLASRIMDYDRDVKNGEWQRSSTFNLLRYPTFEMAGKTIGIIGLGAIGQGVADIAEGFGMNIMYHDPMHPGRSRYQHSTLEELFEESDIVTLHCPLTDQNKHMIDQNALGRMKTSAILINTARGELVDEKALAEALQSGNIAGAGLDVLSKEPPEDSPLSGALKNLVITPHCAWTAREARQRLIDEVAENIKAFSEGKERNVVSR